MLPTSTLVFALTLFFNLSVNAQCPFPTPGFGSGTAPTPGNMAVIETCNFTGEYVTVLGVQAGDSYNVSYANGSGNSVVVYDTSYAVIAFGGTQTTFVAPYSGTYYSATFIGPGCGTDFSCNASTWANISEFDTQTEVSCGQYTWPFNNQTYYSTGVYLDSVQSSNGYDFMYLDLSIISIPSANLMITNSSNVLYSQFPPQPSGSYQWIDCSTNLPIAGETNQSFAPIQGGSYAVIVSDGACTDTSLCEPISLVHTDSIENCGAYTWPLNNQMYDSTGVYIDSVMTSIGYDFNYLHLFVEISPVDLVVIDSANTLYSQFPSQPSGSYQWIDCSTNLPIAGETNQSFSPAQGGSYAVIISTGNCTDTSSCISSYVGLEDLMNSTFSIAPNPTRDFVEVNFEGENIKLEIVDSKGKLLYSNLVGNGDQIDMTLFDSGIYFFHFQSAKTNEVLRVIRE